MKIRLQADADLNPQIRRGLRRREPAIDFREAYFRDGTSDLDVLRFVAEDDRVLVTRDVTTMPEHFLNFVERNESPGIILLPSSRSIGMAIEGLFLFWLMEPANAFRNQIRWLP